MDTFSRRDLVRSSGLLLVSELMFAARGLTAVAQTSVAPSGSTEALDSNVIQYLVDQSAPIGAKRSADSSEISASDLEGLAGKWGLVARHMETIDVDTRIQSVLPTLMATGIFQRVNQSSYDPIIDSAVQALQEHNSSITRSQVISALGPLYTGSDPNAIKKLTLFLNKGLSSACHRIADAFHVNATSLSDASTPVSFNVDSTDGRFVLAGNCWKGKTPQEKYNNCKVAMDDIALAMFFGGAAACLALEPCGALSIPALLGGAATGFATSAVLASYLTDYFCQSILASYTPINSRSTLDAAV